MRLIDADALVQSLIEKAISYRPGMFSNECEYGVAKVVAFECANESKNAPTIDAEPVRHERWIQPDRRKGYRCCSGCKNGGIWVDVPLPKFCGECGAKMDKEE